MKWLARAIAALIMISTAVYAYAGYFGGPVFTEIPSAVKRPHAAAVVLSGDMGFRLGMGPKIAERLHRDGVPVVGVNSLTYFARRRTPQEAEKLLESSIQRALALGNTNKVVLIGQSFGADMLHVGLASLPEDYRKHIASVVLVVPGDTVLMQAWPGELLELVEPDAPALRTALLLDWVPVTCIQGQDEENSLCPHLHLPNLQKVILPGGHALRFDTDRLVGAVRSSAEHAFNITE